MILNPDVLTLINEFTLEDDNSSVSALADYIMLRLHNAAMAALTFVTMMDADPPTCPVMYPMPLEALMRYFWVRMGIDTNDYSLAYALNVKYVVEDFDEFMAQAAQAYQAATRSWYRLWETITPNGSVRSYDSTLKVTRHLNRLHFFTTMQQFEPMHPLQVTCPLTTNIPLVCLSLESNTQLTVNMQPVTVQWNHGNTEIVPVFRLPVETTYLFFGFDRFYRRHGEIFTMLNVDDEVTYTAAEWHAMFANQLGNENNPVDVEN